VSADEPDEAVTLHSPSEIIERLVLSDAKGWRFLVGIVALVWISGRHRALTVLALSSGLAVATQQAISSLRP
jgi:hypothetical protein